MTGWLKKRVLGTTASAIDRAVVIAMQMRGARERANRGETLSHADRMSALADVHATYGGADLILDPDAFFGKPPSIDPDLTLVRTLSAASSHLGSDIFQGAPKGGVFDAKWPSEFEPFHSELSVRYLSRIQNRTARARMYLAGPPRPVIVLIHGYMGGQWMIEERQWPISWLFRLGLDVVLPVLPFHALRADAPTSGVSAVPIFPSADPRLTNEGFRQAIHDLRAILGYLRERGAPLVGAMGMSLGGYTTALLATVTRDLSFAVPMIPLASIADFAREQGRLGDSHEAMLQHEALERANWVVSPLARPSLVPKERSLVIAAESDRITPIAHAQRIAAHFGSELIVIPGGHLLQIGRKDAFRQVARMLEREGIIQRPRE